MGGAAGKDVVVDPVDPIDPAGRGRATGRRRAWWVVVALVVAALVAYVLLGFPANGFPGRAAPGELRHVEETINRAYEACGLDERATIDWFWGQVDVPSTNGIVGDLPQTVALTRDELAHATGTGNYFWLVCP